ncbi:uncharacterized protein KNAG_0J00600 [Huiozyma naganishii CBS 8797]|uniref:Uncharacterized protein n=1 Tax=Huiozyma naganishii (strain ATCC MYA-139 / BCRC 22969 / CBS 8797 / KCTC 17520 / NBRC 10181 / NCYC 3082 / Yp74L-3) TaxID=1071383 RepID=J7RQQ8_HUIN7|nr:hypothetical protein KNAG_0J00600 [Kazachstania naganishii CBS 8797]CCK72143.1 hypothetical protein KNAG_0J00600 [Kazachstania naganishii CBS 8797]
MRWAILLLVVIVVAVIPIAHFISIVVIIGIACKIEKRPIPTSSRAILSCTVWTSWNLSVLWPTTKPSSVSAIRTLIHQNGLKMNWFRWNVAKDLFLLGEGSKTNLQTVQAWTGHGNLPLRVKPEGGRPSNCIQNLSSSSSSSSRRRKKLNIRLLFRDRVRI